MTHFNVDRHPTGALAALRERYGTSVVLTFSRYIYRFQSFIDERSIFTVPISEVNQDWLELQLAALSPNHELAFHSQVVVNHQAMHLPMIDFGDSSPATIIDFIDQSFTERFGEFMLFDSGRSLHGYGTRLLTQQDWVSYMGKLLLLNRPGCQEIVDSRWVGHRLITGYSALRWSANTAQYLKMPTRIV